ncbi:hypothetical protein GCM10027605_74050 [Micromonospora zhanjiangensis]
MRQPARRGGGLVHGSLTRPVTATLPGMAVRGWGGSVATATGVAAGAGAAQLGLGYGLGVVAWLPAAGGTAETVWVASLAWAAWIAATSTVVGALCAARLTRPVGGGSVADHHTGTDSALWRAALAVAAAVGGLLTVALIAVPARAASGAGSGSAQTTAAGYAVAGVLVGLVAALWALSSPAVAGNILATVCWLWFLAVVAVVDGVLAGRSAEGSQLGVWQLTGDVDRFWAGDYFYWPGALISLGSALVIGALAARSAARRPDARVGVVVSGGAGPLLVAVAYFLTAPRLVDIRAEQVSAHLAAPYAVITGLAGSVLVAALMQRAEQRGRDRTGAGAATPVAGSTGAGTAIPAQPDRAAGTDTATTEPPGTGPTKIGLAGWTRRVRPNSETGTDSGSETPKVDEAGSETGTDSITGSEPETRKTGRAGSATTGEAGSETRKPDEAGEETASGAAGRSALGRLGRVGRRLR